MEGGLKDLSDFRIETAIEDLETARILMDNKKYRASMNRSYYVVFHALRAVTVLNGFDSSKHSGIIAYFNKNYVKTGVFPKETSKLIDQTYRNRENADYQDFYIASEKMSIEQYDRACKVIEYVKAYLERI